MSRSSAQHMSGPESGADAARPKPGRFPRNARLLKHASFDQVYRTGQKHFSGNMTVFFLRRTSAQELGPRIGFTVPRALGPAVDRNRIKRRMREAVRRNLEQLQAPVDVVFNPKKSVLTADFQKIEAEVARAFSVVLQKARPPRPATEQAQSSGSQAKKADP